jgi:hypothetical protein
MAVGGDLTVYEPRDRTMLSMMASSCTTTAGRTCQHTTSAHCDLEDVVDVRATLHV